MLDTFRKRLCMAAISAIGGLGIVCVGLANEPTAVPASGRSAGHIMPKPEMGKSLADKIDEFGQKFIEEIFPSNNERRTPQPPPRTTRRKFHQNRNAGRSAAGRAGSILARETTDETDPYPPRRAALSGPVVDESALDDTAPASQPVRQTAVVTRRESEAKSTLQDAPAAAETPRRSVVTANKSAAGRKGSQTDLAALTNPVLVPLHERLKSFRRSAFDNKGRSKTVHRNSSGLPVVRQRQNAAASRPSPTANGPAATTTQSPTPATPTKSRAPTPATPTLATPKGPTAAAPEPTGATMVPQRPAHVIPMRQPVTVRQTFPQRGTGGMAPPSENLVPAPATTSVDAGPIDTEPTGTEPTGTEPTGTEPTETTAPRPEAKETVLFAQKGPVLSVETVGPQRIAVGKESSYVIAINNAGEAADDVVVFVDLPAWADVMGTDVSTGTAHSPTARTGHSATAGTDREPLRWQIGHLQAKGQERLVLRIVPRESRPFDLAVRWDYRPVASQAMIEVQEPKLVLNLEGPRDILYGEKEVYKLRLSNVGTGAAEGVLITLQPVGAGDNQPVSHNLGIIGAGQQRSIEVELTARQVGDLIIQVEVRGDAGVHAELVERVLVRRASLQVDLQGPEVQYVGTVATYRMDVANPGTAPARNVKLSVSLPPGAKYLSGIDGARLEANGTKVQWVLGSLEPAGRKSYIVKCNLSLPGAARMSVLCGADGELTASSNTTTRVEAMADLVLDVKDPSGPIPVGEETSYELRIRNRGTKNAEGVEVVAYFSRGIEPIMAEGAQHRIAAGQVVFSPIPSVAAGEDHVLVIRARAETGGNHIFRAEVHCKPLGVRLVSEESTHFYQSKSDVRQATDPDVPEVSSSPAPGRSIRAVDRRASAVPAAYGPGQFMPVRSYGQPTAAPRQ